jgi:Na+/melibiose symporter-like transporter
VKTIFLYLILLFGFVSVGSGVLLVHAAHKYRSRNARGSLGFAIGLGAFFVVLGLLALIAFAVPSARGPATWAIAALLIARSAVFFVAKRVMKRRERAAPGDL